MESLQHPSENYLKKLFFVKSGNIFEDKNINFNYYCGIKAFPKYALHEWC